MTQPPHRGRPWFLYVVECADHSLYTGISTDVERRVREHNSGRGSQYTGTRRPVVLRAAWRFPDRRHAMQAEIAFKRQRKTAKERAIRSADSYREGSWAMGCG
jgi:putative endonuclease